MRWGKPDPRLRKRHVWFAWYPVVDFWTGEMLWWENVQRWPTYWGGNDWGYAAIEPRETA